jgi:hypothetical protein
MDLVTLVVTFLTVERPAASVHDDAFFAQLYLGTCLSAI